MRTLARETLFKLIYSTQFSEDENGELKAHLFKTEKLNDDDIKYCEETLAIIDGHKDELTKIIDEHSISFPEKRIFPSDRSILLIALAEIIYRKDIPDKVSINEAANIASKYSSEKSATFISGILSTVTGDKNV